MSTTTPKTLDDIEQLAERYAEDRGAVADQVMALQAAIDQAKRAALPAIRQAVCRASESRDRLQAAIEEGKGLFRRPRTRVFSGIRVGLQKSKGKVQFDDEEKVIARIRAQLPKDQAELLIRTKESVHKPGVYDLTAGDLKRLGIRVTDDCDQVVVKPTDDDVDKLVDALLGDDVRNVEEEAA